MGIFYSCFEGQDYYGSQTESNNIDAEPPKSKPIRSAQTTNHEKLELSIRQSINNENSSLSKASINQIEFPGLEGEPIKFQQIVNTLLPTIKCPNKKLDDGSVYTLQVLDSTSKEYQTLRQLFYKHEKSTCYNIKSIKRIDNPYLMIQYTLKKMELAKKGLQCNERIMFHGTELANIHSICQTNFNWRLNGTSTGKKFGQGVSFSPCSYYATHYADSNGPKFIIAAIILVGNCCVGDKDMFIPIQDCDTSINAKQSVFVKYDDNTFYPKYVIHYSGHDPCYRRRLKSQ